MELQYIVKKRITQIRFVDLVEIESEKMREWKENEYENKKKKQSWVNRGLRQEAPKQLPCGS